MKLRQFSIERNREKIHAELAKNAKQDKRVDTQLKTAIKLLLALAAVAAPLLLTLAQNRNRSFEAAADFPRGALVYVQTNDLPALAALWKDSDFKNRYLASENFAAFARSRLGRKLASRRDEFERAAGFAIDFELLGNLSEKNAALALYDIGRLDFVFVAPMRDEIYAATVLFAGRERFTEQTIGDDRIYRTDVEADRGRQRQEILFTHARGKLIVATTESLLARTLANIHSKKGKNSLADEPSFSLTTDGFDPRVFTVWIDQAKLNEDHYFRQYWRLSRPEDLKNIRAGVFDFAVTKNELVERRRFLPGAPVGSTGVERAAAARTLARVPAGTPFYRLESPAPPVLANLVEKTIFDRTETPTETNESGSFDVGVDFDPGDEDYENLSESFDVDFDEPEEIEESPPAESRPDGAFGEIFAAARPAAVLAVNRPERLPAPLFVEFKRGAVIALARAAAFRGEAFENEIVRQFAARMRIRGIDQNLRWESKNENGLVWRELKLPMSDWQIVYSVAGDELILANDADFLREIAGTKNDQAAVDAGFPLTELTVIDFAERTEYFDDFFAALETSARGGGFFTGNVKSLLDAAPAVAAVEIRKSRDGALLAEEITVKLRASE